MPKMPRLALVGDRSPQVQSHQRIPDLLTALTETEKLPVDAYWISTSEVGDVTGFDGIWLLPGSPYASESGALSAVAQARTSGVPFLGSCGGFQHALLEFARNVCGLTSAHHAENDPDSSDLVVVPLACSLVGHQGVVHLTPHTNAEHLLGKGQTFERYFCRYGVNPAYVHTLTENGLVFSGHDADGDVRIAELPGHPFYLAALFQPELADGPRPHPFIRAFAAAATAHAAARSPQQAGSPRG
jgi:CTP synthase (UTP-ammonia lyase)